MSDYNRDDLACIRDRAKKDGKRVTVHGQHVYVHPPKVHIPADIDHWDDNSPYAKYYVMWAMEW